MNLSRPLQPGGQRPLSSSPPSRGHKPHHPRVSVEPIPRMEPGFWTTRTSTAWVAPAPAGQHHDAPQIRRSGPRRDIIRLYDEDIDAEPSLQFTRKISRSDGRVHPMHNLSAPQPPADSFRQGSARGHEFYEPTQHHHEHNRGLEQQHHQHSSQNGRGRRVMPR